jgi:hypothetical protein
MATVEERTSEDGDAAGKECLNRANPGHCAIIAIGNEGGGVVCLENTERVQQAPTNRSVHEMKKPVGMTYQELKNMKKPASTCSQAMVPPLGIEGCAGTD